MTAHRPPRPDGAARPAVAVLPKQPWGFAVPVSEALASHILMLGGVLYLAAGAAGLILVLPTQESAFVHPKVLAAGSAASLLVGFATLALGRARRQAHRWFPLWIWATQLPTTTLVSLAIAAAGPAWGQASMVYVEVPIVAFFVLRPAFATPIVAASIVEYGIVITTQPGWPHPWLQLAGQALVLGSVSYVFGQLLKRGALESERFSQFRRFLPETVAGAVVANGSSDLFEPHRAVITVVFCDLRGFTHFAATASPEDVREVLDTYFATVGKPLADLGATIGAIQGDGVMAYFGDPLPQQDSADRAVAFAVQVRAPMDALIRQWEARGFALSYGIGIAHGYATLGVVGFDGRYDYTALGPVVNLASRLSDAAAPAETLLDKRTLSEAKTPPPTSERSIRIKGYEEQVHVHVLSP